MIYNKQLEKREIFWLDNMLQREFPLKEQFISEINESKVSREQTDYYISITFDRKSQLVQSKVSSSIPIEMVIHQEGSAPMLFLLHTKMGHVSELEILNADSSRLNLDIHITSSNKEIIYDFQR